MQCVSVSSVSLDIYPDEPDTPISPAGKGSAVKGSSTPKGAKAKGNESFQGSLSDGGENTSQSDLVPVKKDVDAFVSIQKYIGPALKGFSPKNQVEVDEAILQQTALEGICMNMQHILPSVLHFNSSLFDSV